MHRISVSGMQVDVVRKDIKNLHLGVYPPEGRVRVAAPLRVDDEAVRLAVITKLPGSNGSRPVSGHRNARARGTTPTARRTTSSANATC